MSPLGMLWENVVASDACLRASSKDHGLSEELSLLPNRF